MHAPSLSFSIVYHGVRRMTRSNDRFFRQSFSRFSPVVTVGTKKKTKTKTKIKTKKKTKKKIKTKTKTKTHTQKRHFFL